jgi:hypothetical protein
VVPLGSRTEPPNCLKIILPNTRAVVILMPQSVLHPRDTTFGSYRQPLYCLRIILWHGTSAVISHPQHTLRQNILGDSSLDQWGNLLRGESEHATVHLQLRDKNFLGRWLFHLQ